MLHQDNQKARQQALNLAAHVSTVMNTVTNTDAVREHMPAIPTKPKIIQKR